MEKINFQMYIENGRTNAIRKEIIKDMVGKINEIIEQINADNEAKNIENASLRNFI